MVSARTGAHSERRKAGMIREREESFMLAGKFWTLGIGKRTTSVWSVSVLKKVAQTSQSASAACRSCDEADWKYALLSESDDMEVVPPSHRA